MKKKYSRFYLQKDHLCEIKRENNWLKSKFEMLVYSLKY